MTEILKNNGLESLDQLQPESFHTLTYDQQLVILQNTAILLGGGVGFIKPLRVQDVKQEEVEVLHFLISNPRLLGPFASTFYERRSAWRNYIDVSSEETVEKIEFAEKKELWQKYVGLADYERHLLGEVNHALNLICEGYLKNRSHQEMMSPGRAIPSYAGALKGTNFESCLFAGAFSLKSVQDIWAIRNYLVKGCKDFKIIDINGTLTPEAAKHYKVCFEKKDALMTRYPSASTNLVMTNCLTTAFETDQPLSVDGLMFARRLFFQEMGRITQKGGKIILTEFPLCLYGDNGLDEADVQQDLDTIGTQLGQAGYTDIRIFDARLFDSRVSVDEFCMTGTIDSKNVIYKQEIKPLLITAVKR